MAVGEVNHPADERGQPRGVLLAYRITLLPQLVHSAARVHRIPQRGAVQNAPERGQLIFHTVEIGAHEFTLTAVEDAAAQIVAALLREQVLARLAEVRIPPGIVVRLWAGRVRGALADGSFGLCARCMVVMRGMPLDVAVCRVNL